jgi:hypothetical protein
MSQKKVTSTTSFDLAMRLDEMSAKKEILITCTMHIHNLHYPELLKLEAPDNLTLSYSVKSSTHKNRLMETPMPIEWNKKPRMELLS